MPEPTFEEIVAAMKKGAGILQDAKIDFILGGGLACWARGGAKTEHDVDFMLKGDDVERALQAFADAGFRTERPPEQWLVKAYIGDVLVDLIFEPLGGPITEETIAHAEMLEVAALRLHVASLEDVISQKLLAITEQEPDYSAVLEMARALREQVDWEEVRARTEHSPFAQAFFTLVEELRVVERAADTA
jgi:hypothetical protein